MNPYEYFDEEYKKIQDTTDNAYSLLIRSKNFYDTVNKFHKEILFTKNITTKDGILETISVLENLLTVLKETMLTTENIITKVKNV